MKANTSLTDIFEELIDDAMKQPETSKMFRSNEFFYETINYQIKWESPLYTTISKLALRNIIELAYNEGQKDALINAQEKVQKWAEDVINKKAK